MTASRPKKRVIIRNLLLLPINHLPTVRRSDLPMIDVSKSTYALSLVKDHHHGRIHARIRRKTIAMVMPKKRVIIRHCCFCHLIIAQTMRQSDLPMIDMSKSTYALSLVKAHHHGRIRAQDP